MTSKLAGASRRAFLGQALTVGSLGRALAAGSLLSLPGSFDLLASWQPDAGDINLFCDPTHDRVQIVNLVGRGPAAVWIDEFDVFNGAAQSTDVRSEYHSRLASIQGMERQVLVLRRDMKPVVITMQPNQVQLWHIVNAAAETQIEIRTPDAPKGEGLQWRQTAQDDLPLVWENYSADANLNATLAMGPANRADLLVQAFSRPGIYPLQIVARTAGQQSEWHVNVRVPGSQRRDTTMGLSVAGFPSAPALYPATPAALKDISPDEIGARRAITFHLTPGGIRLGADQRSMQLGRAEEWRVSNTTSLPRSLHLENMPFQVLEVFDPATMKAPKVFPAPWPWADTLQVPAMIESVSVPGYVVLRFRGKRNEGASPYAYGAAMFRSAS